MRPVALRLNRYRPLLLAPPAEAAHVHCQQLMRPEISEALYQHHLYEVQSLRDSAYRHDHGFAWPNDYNMMDNSAWHILLYRDTKLEGCARMFYHRKQIPGLEDLGIWRFLQHAPESTRRMHANRFANHLKTQLFADGVGSIAEAGGWSISLSSRGSVVAALLASYAWELTIALGFRFCLAAAVVDNGAAALLQKMGASLLIPDTDSSWYVPFHKAHMTMILFDALTRDPRIGNISQETQALLCRAKCYTAPIRQSFDTLAP